MSDKILVGKKGNSYKDTGYVFAPYIKCMEINLPVKFLKYDKNGQAIFIKTNEFNK